jgi:hypothetical protein
VIQYRFSLTYESRFRHAEVAIMVHWEDSSSSSEEEVETWTLSKVVSSMRSSGHASGRQAMRGMQTAIQAGWLIQRARDMLSFSHDRYRQTAESEAALLPPDISVRMSFRVRVIGDIQ